VKPEIASTTWSLVEAMVDGEEGTTKYAKGAKRGSQVTSYRLKEKTGAIIITLRSSA
jgi:hypothetical protein